MIIKESSHRAASARGAGSGTFGVSTAAGAGVGAELVPHIGEATAEDPLGTYFVSYKQFRDELPDDRHKHRYNPCLPALIPC